MELKILFYMFSGLLLMSACIVVFSRNAVYSVLALILAFFNAGGLFLLSGAEFLAMILVIVYVGAVAVLFLFIVMMLNLADTVQITVLKSYKFAAYGTIGLLMAELCVLSLNWQSLLKAVDIIRLPIPENVRNTYALGQVLYTNYFFAFQISGMILLVAMIGAIVLIFGNKRPSRSRKQDVQAQNRRTPEDTLVVADAFVGAGVMPGKFKEKST